MRNLLAYSRVASRILSGGYPYNRFALLIYYITFLLKSFYVARFGKTSDQHNHREMLFGFAISFPSFPEFIQLFEEMFVFEIYKFESSLTSPSIIDCGSNVGVSLIYFKMLYPESHIMAFEPEAGNFSYLAKNVAENNLKDVECYNVGLSIATGKAVLFRALSSPSLNWTLIKPKGACEHQEILLDQLSRYVDHQIDLLKIDVEGAEQFILEDLVVNRKIKLISELIIEYHPNLAATTSLELLNQLEGFGFGCHITKGQLIVGKRK